MPLTNGRYTAPTWVNGQAPAINAAELQAMTNTIEGNQPRIAAITLAAGAWAGSNPYTQTVTISGETITANTKVDLLPSTAVLNQMASAGISELFVTNSNGVLTAFAFGALPSEAIAISAVLQETAAANPNGLALYSGAKVEIVTYVGTGTIGSSTPTSVTFSFTPKLVWIAQADYRSLQLEYIGGTWEDVFSEEQALLMYGAPKAEIYSRNTTESTYSSNRTLIFTWNGNTVEWYHSDPINGLGGGFQLNQSGKTYYALAIG